MKFDNINDCMQYMTENYGAPKAFRLEQYGDLDVTFNGWKVTNVDTKAYSDRKSVDIALYYSDAGTYIGHIFRYMPANSTSPAVKKSKVGTFSSALELLQWLREDGRGFLGTNSKIAWEELCTRLAWLTNNATRHA
jgi:hypothetical protein